MPHLCFDFKTLELLFMVYSGVVRSVVQLDDLPITTQPGEQFFIQQQFNTYNFVNCKNTLATCAANSSRILRKNCI